MKDYYIIEVEVQNELGLCIRPSGLIATRATAYPHEIFLEKDEKAVDAKKATSILTLAACKGTKLTLKVSKDHPAMRRQQTKSNTFLTMEFAKNLRV